MISLYTPLPDTVMVEGRNLLIDSNFKQMLEIEDIIRGKESEEEKVLKIFSIFYRYVDDTEYLFNHVEEATNQFAWFFRGGDLPTTGKEKDSQGENDEVISIPEPVFSYTYDAPYIYTAFLSQYNIDLLDIEYLHWWKFRALFESLKSDHLFSEIKN